MQCNLVGQAPDSEPEGLGTPSRLLGHGQTSVCWADVGHRLKLQLAAGRSLSGSCGLEPDSGNPTVRDHRGALGNIGYGGTRHPLRVLRQLRSWSLSSYGAVRPVSIPIDLADWVTVTTEQEAVATWPIRNT